MNSSVYVVAAVAEHPHFHSRSYYSSLSTPPPAPVPSLPPTSDQYPDAHYAQHASNYGVHGVNVDQAAADEEEHVNEDAYAQVTSFVHDVDPNAEMATKQTVVVVVMYALDEVNYTYDAFVHSDSSAYYSSPFPSHVPSRERVLVVVRGHEDNSPQ